MPVGYRVAVDVGGTFTDFVVTGPGGELAAFKVPSTPKAPEQAVLGGLRMLTGAGPAPVPPTEVTFLGHGTTVATNAVIERTGGPAGLLITEGFGDLLEIGRQMRPSLYDLLADKPEPLVEREFVWEVPERVAADGSVVRPLDREGVRRGLARLRSLGVRSVAICFLNAHANPEHERAAAKIAREEYPELHLSVSHELLAEFREFERLSSVVLNAYLSTAMGEYLDRLAAGVAREGIRTGIHLAHSAGGLLTLQRCLHRPAATLLSGPAAALVAAASAAAGVLEGPGPADPPATDLVTLDMGGTSADVGLVRDGRPAVTTARKVAGWPCLFPMLDIETVGAGGGSVAWVDAGGLLKVGPRSAGAEPGPAAYGRGGEEPTVTDADVVLGRLGPEGLAAGRVSLDPERARRAVWDRVARRLGLSLEEAAWGVLKVAGATMESAVRLMTIERGLDPRDFSLVAFGGAGPLHAVALARALGMPRVIVPRDPGTFSAQGLLAARVRTDAVKTLLLTLEPDRWGRGAAARRVLECAAALAEEVAGVLEEEGIPPRSAEVRTVLDLRYEGQNHEIRVALGRLGSEDDIARAVRLFHRRHHELNGYRLERAPVEVVNVRVEGTGRLPGSGLPRARRTPAPASAGAAAPRSRPVYFGPGYGWLTTPVVGREALEPGRWHSGPLVVSEPDATTLVPPGARVRLVADGGWAGSLVIEPGVGEGVGGGGGGDGDG